MLGPRQSYGAVKGLHAAFAVHIEQPGGHMLPLAVYMLRRRPHARPGHILQLHAPSRPSHAAPPRLYKAAGQLHAAPRLHAATCSGSALHTCSDSASYTCPASAPYTCPSSAPYTCPSSAPYRAVLYAPAVLHIEQSSVMSEQFWPFRHSRRR